jgi:RND family efflux transporter MFP subunit
MRFRQFSAALFLLPAAGCGGRTGAAAHPDSAAATVRVAEISEQSITRAVTATGTLGSKEEIALSFKIGGVVRDLRVDPGASVHAGETLAALELGEIDAAVSRARSAAEKAERDVTRARRLYADSVFTLAQRQDAETGADVARADLETVLFNRRYAVIVAPAAGVILSRRAEPGQLVTPGTTILVLGSRARGSVVRIGLADRDAVRVRRGDRATVRFDALPGREFPGTVSEISAAAEAGTGTYPVEIGITGADGLGSGLVGQVEIRPGAGQRTTLIPVEALLEADGSSATVYVLSADGARAERRRVTVGFLTDNRAAIAAGLEGARRVITDGAAYLQDGARVKVIP